MITSTSKSASTSSNPKTNIKTNTNTKIVLVRALTRIQVIVQELKMVSNVYNSGEL